MSARSKNTEKKDHPFKNHRMPLPMRLFFSATTFTFKILGAISPTLAGKLALRLFMTPPKFATPKREHKLRKEAKLTHLISQDRKISIRSWGKADSPTILLSHGWGGRCTQLHAFIKPLLEKGYRVVGFDAPAHGDSEGKRTNMLDVASVITMIEKAEGPFHAIIAHSFGTGTTLLAIDRFHVKANKIVLIGYFSEVNFIIKLFGELFSLRKTTLDSMKKIAMQRLKNSYGFSWNWKEIAPINTIKSVEDDLLLIHDKDDHEVPYEQAELLEKAAPHAKLLSTSGLGHRKILMDKQCIEVTVNFIDS